MATVKTAKRIDADELHDLLGGDQSDLSTTPIKHPDGTIEGVPLDAMGEKEVTATVGGDGETPITEAELQAAIDACTDLATKEQEEADQDAAKETALASATAKLKDLDFTDAEIEALIGST